MRPQGQRKEFGLFSEWDICFYFFLLSPGIIRILLKETPVLFLEVMVGRILLGHLPVACRFREPPPKPSRDLDKDLSPQSPCARRGMGHWKATTLP